MLNKCARLWYWSSQDFTRGLFWCLMFTSTTASPNPAPINLLEVIATSCQTGEGEGPFSVRSTKKHCKHPKEHRYPPGLCSRSGVSWAIWCPSHSAPAGALGPCCNGLIGAFLMSEMGQSWVERIGYNFFLCDSYSFFLLILVSFLRLTLGWVIKSNGLL